MTRLTLYVFGLLVSLNIFASSMSAKANEENGILQCFYERHSLGCAKLRADAQLDAIEAQVTGRRSPVSFSKVLEEAGALVVDGTRSFFGRSDETIEVTEDDKNDDGGKELGQARKRFGKKKKKMLQKLIAFAMLFKSKITLLLQLISTHFQLKFFVIAVLSLLINATRFWLDLKKGHSPAKVIYYEHAQHQHHYDNDDHGGYWGRADDGTPAHHLAYNAHE